MKKVLIIIALIPVFCVFLNFICYFIIIEKCRRVEIELRNDYPLAPSKSVNQKCLEICFIITGYRLIVLAPDGPFPSYNRFLRVFFKPTVDFPQIGRIRYFYKKDFSIDPGYSAQGHIDIDFKKKFIIVHLNLKGRYCEMSDVNGQYIFQEWPNNNVK